MSDIRFGLFPDDDDVVRGLRAIYAAPAGDAYWNELAVPRDGARR